MSERIIKVYKNENLQESQSIVLSKGGISIVTLMNKFGNKCVGLDKKIEDKWIGLAVKDGKINISTDQDDRIYKAAYKDESHNSQRFPMSGLQVSNIWYSAGCKLVCRSGNVIITKYLLDEQTPITLKVVDMCKSDDQEQDELRNEMDIYRYLEDNKCVPKFYCAAEIDIYIVLVIDFIQGKSYFSFNEMQPNEIEACVESLQELHKSKVLHGDLDPQNFIIVHEETKCKAFIIDFGRSKLVKDNDGDLLIKEMEEFLQLIEND